MAEVTDKVYRALAPKERLGACISALARKDQAEALRLFDTCPERQYRMTDARFGYPLKTLLSMGCEHRSEIYRLSLGVTMGVLLSTSAKPDSESEELADQLAAVSGDILIAKLAGWSRFCREAGLSEEELASIFLGESLGPAEYVLTAANEVMRDLEGGEIDRQAIEERYVSELTTRWNRVTRGTWRHAELESASKRKRPPQGVGRLSADNE